MELAFKSFCIELKEIRNHIQFIDNLKSDINSTSKNFEYSKSSSRKKYDYNSIIISLYGIVENNIEKFITSYIETLERDVFIYKSLNEKISENHFNLSIQLLSKIIENKHQKYTHLKKKDVILNLSYCINDIKSYKFNKEAFIINSGNLKHSKICDVFKNLNINLDKEIKAFEGFDLKTENLFNKIDDLVQRRNEIAHGGVSDILDNSEIIPFVDFIEKYFIAIYNLLKVKAEAEINCFKKNNFSSTIENFRIYSGKILGLFDGGKFNLNIGDEILIEKMDSEVTSSQIIDIKTFPNNDVTLKLDKKIKENYKYSIYDRTSHQEAFLANGILSQP